jgi:CRP-like cAMP-binding protein
MRTRGGEGRLRPGDAGARAHRQAHGLSPGDAAAFPAPPSVGLRSGSDTAGTAAPSARVSLRPLAMRFRERDVLTDVEWEALHSCVARVVAVAADVDILREGDEPSECRLLLEGWASRYVLQASGLQRIMAVQVPGDFLDLHGFPGRRMDHGVSTLTRCRIAVFPHRALREAVERHPRLARLLWLDALVEGAVARRWLLNVGHRKACEGAAHLIYELATRLLAVGMVESWRFRVPLNQAEMASALGMSSVHMNRTMQKLRRDGLVTWRSSDVTIEDWDRLSRLAGFDPAYLDPGTLSR